MPELEQYASDSNVASALTNAREMIRKAEAVLPDAKSKQAPSSGGFYDPIVIIITHFMGEAYSLLFSSYSPLRVRPAQ